MKKILFFAILTFSMNVFAQVSKTINISTSGTLSTVLTYGELQSITNLTVTGTIDARDFKTMRDTILHLTVVDISAVSIAAYSGTDGTSVSKNTDYPANEIPEYAFKNSYRDAVYKTIIMPNSITSIGYAAFQDCIGLTNLKIPNSVVTIKNNAFEHCIGLTSLTIPNSVISLGDYVFYYCSGLTNINISDAVTSIGTNTFSRCEVLNNVTIPSSVRSIGDFAFSGCKGLISITIPNSVISIGDNAFFSCPALNNVTIPNSVTSLGSAAFYDCTGLVNLTISNSLTSIGDNTFYWCTKLTGITIPASVTKIGDYAFRNCFELKELTLPGSVTSIGIQAFGDCYGIVSATIPNSVASIDKEAFRYCSGLKNIKIPNSVTSISERVFSECTGLTSVTIPSSVTSIGISAFSSCSSLTAITIPSSVTSISDYAFSNCIGLSNITIPLSVTSMGTGAFSNCKGLTSATTSYANNQLDYDIFPYCDNLGTIIIPDGLTAIKYNAFAYHSSITTISIPSTVTSIGENSFRSCTGLTSVNIHAGITKIGSIAFYNCTSLASIYCYSSTPVDLTLYPDVFKGVNHTTCILYVPAGSKDAYKVAVQWKDFLNIVEIAGYMITSPNIVKIESVQGSNAKIDITSNVSWKASSDQSWLNVSPGTGSGNGKLTFTATANTGNTIRTAIVTISATGIESRTISVVQSYSLQPTITKLYDFNCQYPYFPIYRSNLINDGTYIYGIMTDISYEKCFLIRIKPDGTGFKELYSFGFYMNIGKISLSENEIYGTVNNSSVFKINTEGSNYTEIDLSDKISSDKFIGSMVVSDHVIYGTIERIVADGNGTSIFKINTDGTGFSTVYSSDWISDLYISENTLISSKNGEIFRINTDGSGYYDLGIPSGMKIITKGSVIYGVAYDNTGDGWNIFKVNLDGTGYTILKSITGSVPSPIESLSISGNTLYGMSYNYEILKVNLDGTDFAQILTDLTSQDPYYEPTLIGEMLCGLTCDDSDFGALFQINTANNNGYSKVFRFGTSTSGMSPIGSLVESGNFLYGNTFNGGSYDMGTLFRINKDGSGFTKLFEFKGKETGVRPIGQLTLIGSMLYGTTTGVYDQIDYGNIFKINIDGTGFTVLHEFDEINGSFPNGSLVLHQGSLYGITGDGGIESHGVVFKINLDGTGFTILSENTDIDTGENPSNGITISNDDVIFGVTTVDYGGVFRVNTDGTGLSKIFEMNIESGDFSYCKPLLINDELFVTTSEGGTNGVGTIFKIKTDGTGFTVLYNFEGIDDDPQSSGFRNNSLILYNGALYGTATGNGINNLGYLYRINLDGTGFTKLSDFNGEYGSWPYLCDLIIDDNEDIYGMTTSGGNYSGGIIYKYSLNETSAENYLNNEKTLVKIFPNPVTNGFQVNGIKEKATIWLTDTNGRLMLTKEIENNEYISTESLPSGLYILKISAKNDKTIRKLMKM